MADQPKTDSAVADRQPYVLVEAFLDGEHVDPNALKDALADPEVRDHLVDVLLIREAIGAIEPLASSGVSRPQRVPRSRAKWLTAAAAIVLVSLTVGYAAGQRLVAAATAPSTVEAVLPLERSPSAPPPTRSIAFTPGINWTDSPGGR